MSPTTNEGWSEQDIFPLIVNHAVHIKTKTAMNEWHDMLETKCSLSFLALLEFWHSAVKCVSSHRSVTQINASLQ